MRKYAREVVFSLTFEYLFTGQKNELGLDMFEKKKLTGDDIAEAIAWAAQLPAHMNVNDMVLMPAQQAGAYYTCRKK